MFNMYQYQSLSNVKDSVLQNAFLQRELPSKMDFLSKCGSKASKKIVTICKFTLCQQNGQRTYGGPPPGWGSRPPPSRDTEVFIGRLPRMVFEDELIPLFASVGELYEFRLMLDFSGTNRGYAYAHYATAEGATKAIKTLNKYEIRPGHFIGVLKSKNNCRLLFGNIKSAIKMPSFSEFIKTATEQVLNVIMFDDFSELRSTQYRISSEVEEAFLGRVPKHDGKFAIVEYENHKAAAVARRVLIPKYGHILAIDWAVPPRDKKRSFSASQDQGDENSVLSRSDSSSGQLSITNSSFIFDSNILSPFRGNPIIRPVPELIVEPSVFDNLPFMHKTFTSVIKYFKYQISISLYMSTDRLQIPLFICREIEHKIVDRISNIKNLSQAIQLLFNYFSWLNEKKTFFIDAEVQTLLQETKMYADAFISYINRRLFFGHSQTESENEYFTFTLPLHLNILYRIILRTGTERPFKMSSITKGLVWLSGIMGNNNENAKTFIEDLIRKISMENPDFVDKATALAKKVFLNAVTSYGQLPRQQNPSGWNIDVDDLSSQFRNIAMH